jgi:hypothetical protein
MRCPAVEARPTSSGSASPVRSGISSHGKIAVIRLITCQRESTATIKAPPTPYQHTSPPRRQNIIEFDCRGLEFTDFKADVSIAA